jgi:nucleolar GTP-binding protein
MNFQYIAPVPQQKEILDIAFRKAREKGKSKKLPGNWLQVIRRKEGMKLDVIKDIIVPKLAKVIDQFPKGEDLPDFYIKLMRLTLDYGLYKKSCAAIDWGIGKIRSFHSLYVRKIAKEVNRDQITTLTKQFYGRISSVLKQINTNLDYLEHCRRTMKTYPDIKDNFIVCLYGFPNVGKTTLLNKLTGTDAKVAGYSFTTTTINAGFMNVNGEQVQVLDVPGTLARKEKMNVIELQAELVLKDLADAIIYVFDLSETSGYSQKKQEKLLKNLGRRPNLFVYLAKTDLFDVEDVDLTLKHYTLDEIRNKIAVAMKKEE